MAGSGNLLRALDQYLELAKESSERWQEARTRIKNEEYSAKELIKDTVEQWESVLGALYHPFGVSLDGVALVSAQIQFGDADTADKTVVLSSSRERPAHGLPGDRRFEHLLGKAGR